jgi:hypothetical protein
VQVLIAEDGLRFAEDRVCEEGMVVGGSPRRQRQPGTPGVSLPAHDETDGKVVVVGLATRGDQARR